MADDLTRGCPRVLGGLVTAVVARRWLVLIVAAVLTALALVAAVRHLGITTDTVDMISDEVPFRQHADAFRTAFPQLDNLILGVVDAPTPEAAEAGAAAFADALRGEPSVRGVYRPGGGFLRSHGLLYLDEGRLNTVLDRLAGAQPVLGALAETPDVRGLADLLEQAAAHGDALPGDGLVPLLDEMAAAAEAQAAGEARAVSWQRLFAPDGGRFTSTRRIVLVRPKLDHSQLKPAKAAIGAARAARGTVRDAGAEVRLTGEAVIEHEELGTVETGGTWAAGLSLIAVAVILLTGLRAPRLVACSLITLVMGLVWTAGLAALVVGKLNLISVAFAVLFLGLGIDFCIHFALRYRQEHRAGTRTAIASAGHAVGCALVLSAVCAALGFMAFTPTAYRGLAELGLIAGLGMGIALLASLTVLPALLAVWRPRLGFPEPERVIRRERRLVRRHGRKVLIGAAVAGVAGVVVAARITFDFNPMNLRDPDTTGMRVFNELASDPDTTPYTVNVLADDLAEAGRLAARFRDKSGFGAVRTLSSYVPDNQDAKLSAIADASFYLAPIFGAGPAAEPPDASGREAAMRRIATALAALSERDGTVGAAASRTREAMGRVDERAALADRWTRYLPGALTFLRDALNVNRVTRDDLPERLRSRWLDADGGARIRVQPPEAITGNADLRRFAERAQAVTPRATGAPVIIHEASNAVIAAFKLATAVAVVAILLVLAVTLRRPRDVLLTIVPLALAAVWTLAAAVMLGIQLNFANVIVLPLLLGLGVSSGIHFVLQARRVEAVDDIFATSTPRAVLFSVATTLASFGTLMVSEHLGMRSMGALLTLAVAFILVAVLVVLPCLIAAVAPPRGNGGRA